jgi:CubicO group peptidase (beta-lactamase class C family)
LLGAIVSRATGRPIEQYAHEVLFSPLGISDVEWSCYADKIPAAASGLRLRSRDLAKIGRLLLDHGRCCGRQVVSEQWIAESTVAHIGPADRGFWHVHMRRRVTPGRLPDILGTATSSNMRWANSGSFMPTRLSATTQRRRRPSRREPSKSSSNGETRPPPALECKW